jgi:hypothetical protein
MAILDFRAAVAHDAIDLGDHLHVGVFDAVVRS